jgi:hypothetical protein
VSNEIEISIREVRTVTLTGSMDDKKAFNSAKKIMSIHKLTNTGNVDDIYKLAASNAADDTIDATKVDVYLDKDGNGILSAEELAAGPLTEIKLAMTESVSLIMMAELPEAIEDGATLHLLLNATGLENTAVETSYVKVTFSNDPSTPRPNVSVTLKAAQSNCETGALIAGQTFGDARIEDMASGECVTMHMRAENTKDIVGEKVKFKQAVPEYASYIANSISVCGWSDSCKLTPRSDSYDMEKGTGDWAHYHTKEDSVVIGGAWKDKPARMIKGVIHAEYRLKID